MASIRKTLAAGGQFGAFWFNTGSPALVEIAITAEPDVVVIDGQHGLWDRVALEHVVSVTRGRVPLLVRTRDHSPVAISQALDAGAVGVIAPLIETAEQAADVVKAARFPPHGKRSAGGLRPLSGDLVAYHAQAVAETVVAVMIETEAGVGQAEAIAKVPGLDMIFIGTGDLAMSLGTFPNPDPRHDEACARILAACRTAGIACGAFTGNAGAAAQRRRQGYHLVVVANDIEIVGRGFADAKAAYEAPDPASRDTKAPAKRRKAGQGYL